MRPDELVECGDPLEHSELGPCAVVGTSINKERKLETIDVRFVYHGRRKFQWNDACYAFQRLEKPVDFSVPIRETQALEDVIQERVRQEQKWGQQNHDMFLYLTILGEEYGETCKAALESRFSESREKALKELREEAVQTAAVALAIVECLDRKKWTWGSHKEESK